MTSYNKNVEKSILLRNGLQLTLRRAVPEDAEQLLVYNEQISGESENIPFGPGEFGMSAEEERAYLQNVVETPTSLYLLAEVDGEIAGVLTFSTGKRPRLQHSGDLGISVLQKYWNLGIGSHLIAYLIEWARQVGTIRKINLFVRTDNLSAVHLYEKHGFVREGLRTRDLYVRGQFTDAYIMGLELDPEE